MVAYGDVVNPDQVRVVDGDGVSTPDVLRVDVGNSDVPVDGRLRMTQLQNDHILTGL